MQETCVFITVARPWVEGEHPEVCHLRASFTRQGYPCCWIHYHQGGEISPITANWEEDSESN